MLANQDTELTQNHSGRKAASRNSWGPCGGPPCPERHGCQSGVFRPSLISPRRLPVVAVEPKRRRWRGRAGDRGKHDSHRPFTNRKAAPGEGTVIRARVGRPIPFRARSAQGPVHFPPAWRVMMRSCHPGQPGQGRRARAEGGMGAKREGANGVECTDVCETESSEYERLDDSRVEIRRGFRILRERKLREGRCV